MAKRKAVWFRHDLRTLDHPPLTEALQTNEPVIAVAFIASDISAWRDDTFGQCNLIQQRFYYEALLDLHLHLEQLNVPLIVIESDPEDQWEALIEQLNIDGVYFHDEPQPFNRQTTETLTQQLKTSGVDIYSSFSKTLYNPGVTNTAQIKPPASLRDLIYKADVKKQTRKTFSPPHPQKDMVEADAHNVSAQILEQRLQCLAGPSEFIGGTTAGQARLRAFTKENGALDHYVEMREGIKPLDESVKLSPWISSGCLSPAMVYEAVQASQTAPAKAKNSIYHDLLFRDHLIFQAMIYEEHANSTIEPGAYCSITKEAYRWAAGKTENEEVNQIIQRIKETGFASSAERKNIVDYFFSLPTVDRRFCGAFFARNLIDYEATVSTGNLLTIAADAETPTSTL
ncbi:deoxyribodipyrimidine photo-lyase (single-stranded DNA-specific) [Salsuginibacillus halophilus]|uniref:Deoxyribodipyrimidine photo-lyase (Single-stranded DNA-specific) n=1 Tax=Salsuginibacillus halophilus TaxID=517424 RepID=A0A2P8HBM0_9BACI|nr:deoxyribodipyrimidine photo-lyase [Salsuginibacillus halophilus]PSL43531.1 deoxyribodipyrimidine photo-lyase (single-stranded DNA-specific) [Salsuginibacillus halophilus]